MHVTLCMQNTEETIAKYAVEFRLGSTSPKKNIQPLDLKKKIVWHIYFWYISHIWKKNIRKNNIDNKYLEFF